MLSESCGERLLFEMLLLDVLVCNINKQMPLAVHWIVLVDLSDRFTILERTVLVDFWYSI